MQKYEVAEEFISSSDISIEETLTVVFSVIYIPPVRIIEALVTDCCLASIKIWLTVEQEELYGN